MEAKKKIYPNNQDYLFNFFLKRKKKKILKNKIYSSFKNKDINQIIHIQIKPNNTIITKTNIKGDVLFSLNAGKLGLQSSKKNYKTVHNLVLSEFFKKFKKEKKILFKITSPRRLRKKLIRRLKHYFTKENIFEAIRYYSFNGCRPPKIRRKKRKGFKVVKPII